MCGVCYMSLCQWPNRSWGVHMQPRGCAQLGAGGEGGRVWGLRLRVWISGFRV